MPPIPSLCIWLAIAKCSFLLGYFVIVSGGVGLGSIFLLCNVALLAVVYFGITKRKFRKVFCLVALVLAEVVLVESLYHYVNSRDYQLTCEIVSALPVRSDDHHVRHIFFLQTSTNSRLSSRIACAIESASLHHPDWNVTLYSVEALAEGDPTLRTLRQLSNFRLELLDLDALYEASPLQAWYQSGKFTASPYPANKLSNPTRYLLLYRQGGIYLDSDVLVLRSMAGLRNAVGLEHAFSVNNAVLVFDEGHPLLKTVIDHFESSYSSASWGTEGPKLFTQLLPQACSNSRLWGLASYDYPTHPERCPGLNILPSYAFYPLWFFPVPFYNIFRAGEDVAPDLRCSFTLHLWNSMSKEWHSGVGSEQLVDALSRQHCPRVYENVVKRSKVGI